MELQLAPELTQDQQEMAERKYKAWGGLGVEIYKSELQLQARAQQLILSIVKPENILQVPQAELLLKALKKGQSDLSEDRLKITRDINKVVKRLAEPEESLNGPQKDLADCILKIKQDYEREEKAKDLKNTEAKNIREQIKTFLASVDMAAKTKISNQCVIAFEYALTKEDIKPENIGEFTAKCLLKLGVADFMVDAPTFLPKYHTAEEVEVIVKECFIFNPHAYVSMYQNEMKNKFSDYSVAYNNKQIALEESRKSEELKNQQLLIDKQQAEVSAKLESASTTINAAPIVRAVKKFYEVDMPESFENLTKIWAAFTANINLCLPKMRSKKPFAWNASQLMAALGSVKDDDNNFQPSGIIFKEVEKL